MESFSVPDRGQSASVSWSNVSEEFVTYELIVEFKDPIAPSNNNQLLSFDNGERQVLTHLSKLLDTQSMADVTFIVKNEKIGAHSAIIASASPVIRTMLDTEEFKEGRTKEVKIGDIEPVVFKEMLRYLYTGIATKLDEDDTTEQLFLAAHKYQIEALKDLCEQRLISKLNVQTAVHYLIVAYLRTAPLLLEASLEYLVKHKKETRTRPEWKELMNCHPDLFFLAANRLIG
jgi:speckle-type POZ protein